MKLYLLADSDAEADKWAATRFVAAEFVASAVVEPVRPFTVERITLVLAALSTLFKAWLATTEDGA